MGLTVTRGFYGLPGSSLDYPTGGWRTGTAPRFLADRCTDCRFCLLVCPEGIIVREGRARYSADYDYCKGCGICAEECPVGDIVMVPEAELALGGTA